MRLSAVHCLFCVGLMIPVSAATIPFDSAVAIADAQAPGVWYVDRYAPAGFTSPVLFLGDNRLLLQISASDCQSAACRGTSFEGAFYNTQGRKYDLDAGSNAMSIDLFIDGDWATTGRRMAGLWGTAFDGSNQVSFFPILEFTSAAGVPRFRAWNGGGWTDMGLPTGFTYNSWQTLAVTLAGALINYQVGDRQLQVDANGSTYFGNTMLQGYNNVAGVSYDVYWDNLNYSAPPQIPEPTTAVLLVTGAVLLALFKRGLPLVRRSNLIS